MRSAGIWPEANLAADPTCAATGTNPPNSNNIPAKTGFLTSLFFNCSSIPVGVLCTQFLYEFPPKLPLRTIGPSLPGVHTVEYP